MNLHIHYPRIWNSIQIWSIEITTSKAQVYFIFEHKNFLQGNIFASYNSEDLCKRKHIHFVLLALINDWASSVPPDIYSFVPYIYDMMLQGDYVEILIPCNQGNWIDCANGNHAQQRTTENSERNGTLCVIEIPLFS